MGSALWFIAAAFPSVYGGVRDAQALGKLILGKVEGRTDGAQGGRDGVDFGVHVDIIAMFDMFVNPFVLKIWLPQGNRGPCRVG